MLVSHSKLVPLSRHSHLPELMNFVTLFRPLRVIPNFLDSSLNGLDWGAMSKMFSECLSPVSAHGSLESVIAPYCSLTSHASVTGLPGPSTNYDPRTLFGAGEEGQVDTAYSNMVGPSDAADEWGDKGGRKERMQVLKAWIGTRRRSSLGRMHPGVDGFEDTLEKGTNKRQLIPGSVTVSRTAKEYAFSDDSDDSSNEGGSDEHARTAWKFFGVGEPDDECNTWLSPSPESASRVLSGEGVVDMGTLPIPTSSPLPRERRLVGDNDGKERAIEHASQEDLPLGDLVGLSLGKVPTEIALPSVILEASGMTSSLSPFVSPFVSFDDARLSGQARANEVVGFDSQPFASLDNIVLSKRSQDLDSPHPLAQHSSQSQKVSQLRGKTFLSTQSIGDVGPRTDVEHEDEAPRLKRRNIDREESNGMMHEKEDTRTRSNNSSDNKPVNPQTAARRAERALRRRITEKLCLARPDLAVQAHVSRRGSKSRVAPSSLAAKSTFTTVEERPVEVDDGPGMGMTVAGEDTKMDWKKSRRLAERVREAVRRGERASDVLPRLTCLERWYAERERS